MLERQDELEYYQNPAISNSSLSLISEKQGGSPKLFKMYKDGRILRKPQSLNLQNGSYLHLFCEKPELFVVSEVDKPNASIIAVVEQYELIKDTYLEETQEQLLIRAARLANYYNNYKDETLLKTLLKTNIIDYIEEANKNNGKHILTYEQKLTIEGCIKALQNHEACRKYLFDDWGSEWEVYNEYEIYFNHLGLDCKNRLDKLYVNRNTKQLILVDLKSTSKKVSQFKESWEYFHYYRQPAFYKLGLSYDFPGYSLEVYYPIVDTQYFGTCCYKISDSEIDRGEIEYTELMNLINA